MHRFYADSAAENGFVSLAAEDRSHALRVLRLQPGDEIEVFLSGRRWRAELTVCREEEVTARLLEALPDTEPGLQVTLYQGLPKGEKMELIVQKAVELGACRIIPVGTARSVVKLDDKRAEKKTARWQTIAESAASQSHRGALPQVMPVMSFKEALELAKKECGVRLIPYELQEPGKTRGILDQIRPGDSVAVFIGPEGGFEPGEVEAAKEAGFVPISLGRRILRTETAGLAFLSFMIYCLEL